METMARTRASKMFSQAKKSNNLFPFQVACLPAMYFIILKCIDW